MLYQWDSITNQWWDDNDDDDADIWVFAFSKKSPETDPQWSKLLDGKKGERPNDSSSPLHMLLFSSRQGMYVTAANFSTSSLQFYLKVIGCFP